MAYLALLWKARTIEKCRLKYEKEKINSILATNTELPRNTLCQKWTVYRTVSEKRLGQITSNFYPESSKIATSCSYVKENSSFLLRNVIGIVGGIVLLYFSCKIFVFELAVWSIMSWALGVVIMLGLVFSYRVRCLVLLLVPGLFSRVGRYTLACYALVLILTGPATNTIKNLDTLSECLACGQEQIKTSLRQMKESRDNSLNLVQETMNATIEKIQYLATKMKEIMVKIHRLTMSIAHVLQSSLSWLSSVENTCNKELGTPYHHCVKTLARETKNSEKKLKFSGVLKLDDVIQAACFSMKSADPLCMVGDFTKGSIVATVKNKLMTYSSLIQSLLSVAVHIRRSHYHPCCNGSAPVSLAAAGLVTDLRNRADPILTWLSWSCTLTGLFLLLTIFRAKYYQFMFRTRSRFDNRYITKELRELDLKRQRQGRETVLPLNTRERVKYVSTASLRLLPSERTYLARSIVFMIITTLKLLIHMVADYSLYWVLMNIRSHGITQDSKPTDRTADIRVQGSGPLAATVRMLLEALSVPLALPTSSPRSCLPNPHPPDLERYAQIGTLILSLWLLAVFEPYGLRLRHVITGHYQPERAKARAVWLYYHIIRTRNCFLKYARRKLHREYKYTTEEKFTFKRWLSDCIPCGWLRSLLGVGPKKPRCLLCCTKHRQGEPDRHLKTCETPSCPGVYCARCFMDIGQLCTICYSPKDYGDLSDVSLERFRSDYSGDDDGDDDPDYEGDNKPLLGTSDYVINGDQNETHTKVAANRKQKLTMSRRNDNQESLPLLDCDSLNKDYTQEKKTHFEYVYRIDKLDKVSTQQMVTRLKTNQLDCSNKRFPDNNQVTSLHKERTFPRDLEITIKGVRIPKERLGAIVRTMMLLTAKTNDEYIENENYLKYEPFQSFSVIEKCFKRHTRCAETEGSNISLKTKITFLDSMLSRKVTSSSINLATVSNSNNSEPNHEHVPDYSRERSKNEKFTKRNNNKRARKRNMKRYLEIRKLITTHVTQRMRKRRIRFKTRKISWKRRRRRYNSYSNLNLLMRITSKAFTNKTNDNERSDSSDDCSEVHNKIKSKQLSNKTSRSGKQIQQDTNYSPKNGMIVMHAAEWCSKSNACNFSTFHVPSVDAINNSSVSKNYEEINTLEVEKEIGPLTTDQHMKQTKNRKINFWANLCLRMTENQSRTFSSTRKEKLLLNNLFWNHKRRKKLKMVDSIEINKARRVDDDARKYRISLYMKDQEWIRNAIKDKGIVEEKNKEIFLGPNTHKGLAKEKKHLKKDEIKMKKHEIDLGLANHSKLIEVEQKAELDREKQKDVGNNHHDETPTAEFDYGKDYKNEPVSKDSSFIKILKKISKTALNLPKLHEVTRSVNVYYNSPHLEIKCESNDNSETRHNYTNNSGNKYKKRIESGENTVEDLKREIMFDNEQFKITSDHDVSELMTSDYNDIISTDSKIKDYTKSVNSSAHVMITEQNEHECSRTDRGYDNIKHTFRNAYYQVKSKPQKATNNRCTNIPTLDEVLKNTKGIQINLLKYNKLTQTVNFCKPGPNVPPPLHYGEYKFDNASCGCKDNLRKKMQKKKPPEHNISLTNENIQEQNFNKNYNGFNVDNKDVEKGENKDKPNQGINEVFNIEEHASYVHNLSIEATLHDSNESVASCDHAHVWRLEPKTHGLFQSREAEETSETEPEKTTENRGTIISNISELVLRCNEMKSVCNSINVTRRNLSENNSSKNKEIRDKCTSCHTQRSCDSNKCSRLRRWLQDKLCVSSSTKLKNIAKLNKRNLRTQTKRIPVEHTQTQCFCSSVCQNKQVSVYPADLIRNRTTQTQRTPVKHNETQYCICTVCHCPREDNGLQTEKPEMSDFASQYRYPPYDVSGTEKMNSSVSIEYTNEKSETKKQANLIIWSVASTDQITSSVTRTVNMSTTTYDWWSPIVEKKPVKADPLEMSSSRSQSEWSFSRYQKQSSPMGSASDKWCMPVTAQEQSNALKYFKCRATCGVIF